MVIFQQDVMLTKPEQEKARKKMFEKIKKMGFENAGIEFLFIQTSEAKNLEKLESKARGWKNFIEKNFEETRFSIHSPWAPFGETSLIKNKDFAKQLKKISGFCSDFIDVINVHAITGMPASEWRQKFSSIEQREKTREIVSQRLAELTDYSDAICVEVVPVVEEESFGDCVGFLTCMPSDFEWFLKKNKKLNVTIDTCHTGINIQACRDIAEKGKWREGFYKEEMDEIKRLAKTGDDGYLKLSTRIRHLHYSDLGKFSRLSLASHGAIPGEGHRSEQEMISVLKAYEKAAGKKEIGAVLEINEVDYTRLENIEKAFELLKSYQYH